MGFELDGYFLNLKKGGGSWEIKELKSVGVWIGEAEITNSETCPEGILTKVVTQFKNMTKSKPDKPKPMTFSWEPTKELRSLFQSNLRKAKFEIRMGVKQRNSSNFWSLTFSGVQLSKAPSKKGKVERIEATFITYYPHPEI